MSNIINTMKGWIAIIADPITDPVGSRNPPVSDPLMVAWDELNASMSQLIALRNMWYTVFIIMGILMAVIWLLMNLDGWRLPPKKPRSEDKRYKEWDTRK